MGGLKAGPLVRRAEMAAARGDRWEALSALAKAERVHNVPPDMLAAIGILYLRLGEEKRAVRCLRRAVEKRPRARVLTFLGWALFEAGRPKEAEKVLREAYRRYPKDPEVLNSLGYFYAERGKNLKEALVLLEEAVRRSPHAYHIVDSLGWAYFKLGRLEDARRELERALVLGGRRDPEVRYHLAVVYEALGLRALALREVRASLRLDPFHAPAQALYLRLTSRGKSTDRR